MNKIIFTLIFLLIIPLVTALPNSNTMGEFNQNDNIYLCQVCSDASFITYSIKNPLGEIIILNEQFDYLGEGLFCSEFNNTNIVGKYEIMGISDGCTFSYVSDFNIIRDTSFLFGFDFNDNILIIIFVIFVIVGIILYLMKFIIWSGFIISLVGFILLFNEINIIISIIIVLVGMLIIFTKE